ncbi:uncharacterized protein LOC125836348 [Solanum verrucosum]|uniref:uncharacterized protein LOC125836348 n=1 Tax=Solanum verrucosum TaxID=315347 RepID=UPI0020D04286|nr:uncharacterized protein LOC125836348 [Solanum verrucosum]
MAEEFQEREILFPQEHEMELQNSGDEEVEEAEFGFQLRRYNNKVSMIRKIIMKQDVESTPMNKASLFMEKKYNFFEDEYVDDDDEMVPPDMIIKRRIIRRMMSFSICIGYGGTLRRRNLIQVRDLVLRMIGFIES